MIIARIAAVALLAIALCGQAPVPRFDLECPGTRQWALNGPLEAITTRIRIDLEAGQYCFNECDTVMTLHEVTASEIVLHDDRSDTVRRQRIARGSINRVTGAYRNFAIETRPIASWIETLGQCERRPFTGFPAQRF